MLIGRIALALAALILPGPVDLEAQGRGGSRQPPFTVVEASIPEMQEAMREGRITSHEIVTQYLVRIATYEDRLNAAITVNPQALETAAERDRERAAGKIRGPLHGIPIAVKDNIHTLDMPTTGGALAFDGFIPPYEATLVRNLREAGAIIIAKTMMTELANWVATGMPTNYNALTGYGMNPYDPRRDPRDVTFDGRPALAPGGSSSGAGTAANFWTANVGTETSGSILNPASQNMLVAIKPTVGRVSRHGVIPITADQDTPGPMAKSVTDAAILLGVLEGARADANDAATTTCTRLPVPDYTGFLRADGLRGARIGIPRAFFYEPITLAGDTAARGGLGPAHRELLREAIAVLREQGAIIVDPADIPSVVSPDPKANILRWPVCSGEANAKGKDANCSVTFKYGMKRDFEAWLRSLGPTAPVRTLTELRQWNLAHQRAGALKYGQAQLDISDEMNVEADQARYRADRAKDLRLSATEGIDAVMDRFRLDALLFPGPNGAAIGARPGYPSVIVPFGFIQVSPASSFPAGFDPRPAPFGVTFTGRPCAEPRLIELAYAFEQATRRRTPPSATP
ncbi:MAG: amidase [Gemmatimonadetes bacterium]|nr:amidase [Gemmatimonadota bacterium]